ncbi:hypothetical protein Poly24_31270 [Rosistilla carotiformis]|uniref:Uncharacterized protein n=1 Tax=Rosistilla carotiformis TaxID=2528017 RepID=A0A518JV27_9BACT|nr:hypothetical protein Poly24_31270 [Rosistilla carotiformis]
MQVRDLVRTLGDHIQQSLLQPTGTINANVSSGLVFLYLNANERARQTDSVPRMQVVVFEVNSQFHRREYYLTQSKLLGRSFQFGNQPKRRNATSNNHLDDNCSAL